MGKVGDDEFGDKMVYLMNKLRVQTRVVKVDGDKMTGCGRMRIGFNEGRRTWRRAETVEEEEEDLLLGSELNLAVLEEVNLFSLCTYSHNFQSQLMKLPIQHNPISIAD